MRSPMPLTNALTIMAIFANPLSFISATSPHIQTQNRPEFVAKLYMTAFLNGDYKKASLLLHPDALIKIKKAFFDGLNKSRESNVEKEFLKEFGCESANVFENLSPVDLFIALKEGADKRHPPDFEFRKKFIINIISTKLMNNNSAMVKLQISAKDANLDFKYTNVSELKMDGTTWKVLSDIRVIPKKANLSNQ